MQVWIIDSDGFYENESRFVEEVADGMTTLPLLVGYVKPQFNGSEWQEGATEEEIQAWKDSQQIDICPEPTIQEEVESLKEQVLELSDIIILMSQQ